MFAALTRGTRVQCKWFTNDLNFLLECCSRCCCSHPCPRPGPAGPQRRTCKNIWCERKNICICYHYISIIIKIIYAPDGCWLGEHGGVGGLGEDGGVIVDVVDVDDELRGAGAGRRAWADTAVWDIYILHSAGEMLLELEMKVHTKDRNHGERTFTLKTLL